MKGRTRYAPQRERYARIAPAAFTLRGHTNSYKSNCEPSVLGRVF
jgi:hypothetical protein